MRVLGLSAYYHDSAAAVVQDGTLVAAMEEERFSRVKHDRAFPMRAVRACLEKCDLTIRDIDVIAYYEKPLRKFERVLEMCASTYPFSLRTFVTHMPEWLTKKITIEQQIRELGYEGSVHFVPHHLSHAACAFYPSPFTDAAILTVDGVGEYETAALWRGNGNEISELASIRFPHSLGLFYSTMTAFLGLRVNDDEYKVMGLSAYGKPAFTQEMSRLLVLNDDGSFSLAMEYFTFRESPRMWSRKLEALLGPPRSPRDAITARHRDLAASVQAIMEDAYFNMLKELHRRTALPRVCIGGGVALNATANGKISSHTPFSDVWVMGAAGDSGAAAGAALCAYHKERRERTALHSLSLGTTYDDAQIKVALDAAGTAARTYSSEEELLDAVCDLLERGNSIGWFQGAMEFGPRALGNRSIIADPRTMTTRTLVNERKDRFQFQPFAGSILQEKVAEFFDVPPTAEFPFMTLCAPARNERKGEIPAILHEDGTCRIQTVSTKDGRWYRLVQRFYERTGVPCLLNTSFNAKGEPIVEHPSHAIKDFLEMPLDALVIGNHVVRS